MQTTTVTPGKITEDFDVWNTFRTSSYMFENIRFFAHPVWAQVVVLV